MSAIQHHAIGRYRLGARHILSHDQLQRLEEIFDRPPSRAAGVLAGRQSVALMDLNDAGPVAVKHYARGGMMRHLNRRFYLHWPRSRGESEFRWLEAVRRAGVAAPQPLAFAFTGDLCGQCWLITSAIPGHRSLIQAAGAGDLPEAVCEQAAAQIRTLIRQGIWHRDLHPGNVLLDEGGRPHLIDFDKARYVAGRRLLAARYRKRWRRAIAKHGLPSALERVMELARLPP